MKRRAFTLVELLVVIVIVGILLAILYPSFHKAILKAKVSRVLADIYAIKSAALVYYADTGRFPPDDDPYRNIGLIYHGIDFLENRAGVTGWNGPYLDKWPKNPFCVRVPTTYESGYQWEGIWVPPGCPDVTTHGFDFGNGNEPCIEIGILDLNLEDRMRVHLMIDKAIDDGNHTAGNYRVRVEPGNEWYWGYYRVSINPR
ncbi:MAG: prepilin-type N-terminal cleavage/methylation domain-containing protein [Synergistetes bacterium]|nr:prepilin-type N-terminal cleavage/methylation domain-containing protein [Synergistota bacterium]MDW8191697.1 prepilin-type N-terminal cleavage/methylation domain-containing protein [Synergistota bacterium]